MGHWIFWSNCWKTSVNSFSLENTRNNFSKFQNLFWFATNPFINSLNYVDLLKFMKFMIFYFLESLLTLEDISVFIQILKCFLIYFTNASILIFFQIEWFFYWCLNDLFWVIAENIKKVRMSFLYSLRSSSVYLTTILSMVSFFFLHRSDKNFPLMGFRQDIYPNFHLC